MKSCRILALPQFCAITPPVATVRMLVALLANHAPAAATPRTSDGKTPLHLLCRAVTVDRDHYVPPPRADGGDGDDDESVDSAEEDFADEDDRVGVWRLARGAPRLIRALLEKDAAMNYLGGSQWQLRVRLWQHEQLPRDADAGMDR